MRGLTGEQFLRAWERGTQDLPALRALALLEEAQPDHDRTALEALPLGERDARLLAIRDATFGEELRAVATCPSCGERLELALRTTDLVDRPPPRQVPAPALRFGDLRVRLRPVASGDLAAGAACADLATARRRIALRCVEEVHRGDEEIASDSLPDAILPELSRALEEADPGATHGLSIRCAACENAWDAPFDIADFLWAEVEAEALRLLEEVRDLARGLGWSEAEILAMAPLRRRAYLELLA